MLTAGWIAKDLDVTENTLAIWRSRKQGPPFWKYLGTIRYPKAKYLAWKDANFRQTEQSSQ